MVRIRAKLDHSVHAPAPELGRPSIPAPTQTLAMMLAPPMSEGDRLETGWSVTLRPPPAWPETHPDPEPLPGKGCAPSHSYEIGRATSELQSRPNLVCRLLLEKKNNT